MLCEPIKYEHQKLGCGVYFTGPGHLRNRSLMLRTEKLSLFAVYVNGAGVMNQHVASAATALVQFSPVVVTANTACRRLLKQIIEYRSIKRWLEVRLGVEAHFLEKKSGLRRTK